MIEMVIYRNLPLYLLHKMQRIYYYIKKTILVLAKFVKM